MKTRMKMKTATAKVALAMRGGNAVGFVPQ